MTVARPPLEFWKNGIPPVTFYEGSDYMYSNFAAFSVCLNVAGVDMDYMTAEHAYQAHKFPESWELQDEVRQARSAHDAKKIARRNDHLKTPKWDAIKLQVMEKIVRAKLRQHPYIQQKLLKTGSRLLFEDSPEDSFWGRGPDWQGKNQLGKLWMRLREELRSGTFE